MAHVDIFGDRGAMPIFDGAMRPAEMRAARGGSGIGGFFRFVFFAVLLVAAGYGGLQWFKWHQGPGRFAAAYPAGSNDSTANSHLPANLPVIRVKERDEP